MRIRKKRRSGNDVVVVIKVRSGKGREEKEVGRDNGKLHQRMMRDQGARVLTSEGRTGLI